MIKEALSEPVRSACIRGTNRKNRQRDDGIARWVISMDHLLRRVLVKFICRGTMVFTTASGERFACGDGTGEPVFARFLTTEAERRVLLNPELALGEIYMEGNFVVENGTISDALEILMDQPDVLPRSA